MKAGFPAVIQKMQLHPSNNIGDVTVSCLLFAIIHCQHPYFNPQADQGPSLDNTKKEKEYQGTSVITTVSLNTEVALKYTVFAVYTV